MNGAGPEIDEIVETFAFFDDWEDKYRYLIELGKDLPGLPDTDKTDERLIRGCQSQVWLDYAFDADRNRLHLALDSDAFIVRGLISVVLAALNDRSPEQILEADVEALFDQLDLLYHLSPTRGNGLRAMIAKIRSVAESLRGG